jgi:diguanylate cyclase (GGDEF)-like protein
MRLHPPSRGADVRGVTSVTATGTGSRDFSASINRYLVNHLRRLGGPELVARVLARAGEARSMEELTSDGRWSSYAQVRALYEAASHVLGGPPAIRPVGSTQWDEVVSTPALADALQSLGSPDALFACIDAAAASVTSLVTTQGRPIGERHWELTNRFADGFEPFAEYCQLSAGLFSDVPKIYGQPVAEVAEVECQLDGAAVCRFVVRWEAPDEQVRDIETEFLRRRVQVLEARLDAFQDTVAGLVSGQSLEDVLAHVVAAAAQAVQAPGFVLALEALPWARQRLYWDGLDEADASRLGAGLLAVDGPGVPGCLAVDVASNRHRYGRLAAVRAKDNFLPHERELLEAYGRLAAATLDAAAALEESRRQHATAEALLELSAALANLGTTDEVAQRLARAVPAVVDCDRAVVTLRNDDGTTARVVGVHGYTTEAEHRLRSAEILVPASGTWTGLVSYEAPGTVGAPSSLGQQLMAEHSSSATVTVPLVGPTRELGWVTAAVVEGEARLRDDDTVGERLRAIAGQAATAISNAQLLDQVRWQALHDPLTGLANQRLLREQARTAIAQAARADEQVGLVFLDLDDFKAVNDSLGHRAGDELLCQVAERLRRAVRQGDTVARFGGDEFVLLLPRLGDGASRVLADVEEALGRPCTIMGTEVHPGASLGLAVYPAEGADFGELLQRADSAMYEAKIAHRAASGRR